MKGMRYLEPPPVSYAQLRLTKTRYQSRLMVCYCVISPQILLKGHVLALRLVLHNPYLPPATHSLASRVLVGLNLTLPSLDPAQLSHDVGFHTETLQGMQIVTLELCASSWGAMDRSMNVIMHELLDPPDVPVSYVRYERYELLVTSPRATPPLLLTEISIDFFTLGFHHSCKFSRTLNIFSVARRVSRNGRFENRLA